MEQDYNKENVAVPPRRIRSHSALGSVKIVLFLLLLLVVAGVCAVGILLRFSSWDGQSSMTFLVVFEGGEDNAVRRPLAVVTLQPFDHSISSMELPEDLQIETLYGYGPYPSSALYGLMKLEHLPPTFLEQTIAFQFGIPARNIVFAGSTKQPMTVDMLSQSFWKQLFFRETSTFPYLDRFKAWWFLSHVRKDKMTRVDLVSSGAVNNSTLDIIKSDEIVSKIFPDPLLQQEQVTVAVVNTTAEPKIATRVGRALFDMGINVVRVTDSRDGYPETHLVYTFSDHKRSLTSETIQHVFGMEPAQVSVDTAITADYRADIVLLLGEDAASMFLMKP